MNKRVFVIGAGGAVGEAIASVLARGGWRVTASMHTRRDEVANRLAALGIDVAMHNIAVDASWERDSRGCDALIFTPNLALTAHALSALTWSPARVVAFSSNNVAADPNAASYRDLAAAERSVRARLPHAAIIRPTLIYGDPRLATLTRLLRMARDSALLPLPGSSQARVQPVFHRDLGNLASVLARADAPAGVFAVGGPDVVTMGELYATARRVAGGRGVIVPVPRAALRIARALGATRGVLTDEQVDRAGADRRTIEADSLPDFGPRTPLAVGLAEHFRLMSMD